jgi:hypothetical protein
MTQVMSAMNSLSRYLLELHVPLIKLPKLGKLRIVIEESLGGPDYNTKHQVSILYLEYKPEKAEDMVQEDYREEEKGIDTVDVLAESEFVDNKADNDHEKLTSDNQKEVELTKEELEYLHKREEILKENQELKSVDETEEKREELKLLSSTEHELKLLSELGKEEE